MTSRALKCDWKIAEQLVHSAAARRFGDAEMFSGQFKKKERVQLAKRERNFQAHWVVDE